MGVLGGGRIQSNRKEVYTWRDEGDVVGDAKYFSMVKGQGLPPAKFSVIAEYVWLLERAPVARRFLVFGNDRRVPNEWLRRYGNLVDRVEFYFLSDDGDVELLAPSG